MDAQASTTVHSLPPEILSHVFGFLAGAAPSEALHGQPSDDMLAANIRTQNLKAISLVSRQWRSIVLPQLYRNIVWRPEVSSLSNLSLQPVALLRFILDNALASYVSTFTMLVTFAEDEIDARQIPHQIRPADLEWLWDRLFSVIDPLRFTVIAPPTTLAALLNRMLFLDDAWSFNIPYHVLSLARPARTSTPGRSAETLTIHSHPAELKVSSSSPSSAGPPSSTSAPSAPSCKTPEPAPPCALFNLRPWTSILLNEGSSTRVYSSYEFFLRSPPSILSALLGFGEYPNNAPLLPGTIVDFNYIAIFPLSSHFYTLISNLPKVDRLFVQLTPRPGNQLLQDRTAMKNVDMADLWMERNTSYSYLIGQLTVPTPADNWATLKVFESGDAADKESWDMAVNFLERSGVKDWKTQRDGVLVKLDEGKTEMPSGAGMVAHHLLGNDTFDGTIFQGEIRRIAFNGVARLPYSSMWLYLQDPPEHNH
ncbi:uncharacterized protein BCR38DRAFT_424634 [Pseudomassariella vexata]|uniref:F-box domain-containing protein n=1 Tax=Pseudomassariella vexata TaxID=1141098 RepID=A0A1Y2EBF4_9PEZI|nr:uncharacterized protein BCR38DRAFT_424634 [Pseudomassariella vexata]ORY68898.1 hypothetical protein BCR38DRAFT_424634 [Pseudomassariella vexata]